MANYQWRSLNFFVASFWIIFCNINYPLSSLTRLGMVVTFFLANVTRVLVINPLLLVVCYHLFLT
jgi:hypothetical protein